MTTKKEKKGSKKAKSVKNAKVASKIARQPGPGAERKKIVAKTSVTGEIDKEKMAAFFSAGGLKESVPEVTLAPVSPIQPVAEPVENKVVEASQPKAVVAEVKAAEVKAEVKVEEPPARVVADDQGTGNQNVEENKGKVEMTTTVIAKENSNNSNSGNFSILPMFVILLFVAAFWFYYISATPLQQAAVVQVEQSQAKILLLEAKVNSLQAEIATLHAKLADLQKAALKPRVKLQAAPPAKVVKDKSFDKAPIPFWRTMQHPHAKQMEKLRQHGAKATVAKTVKEDSFSKAPIPFWRKSQVGKAGAKTKSKSVVTGNHDSSFDKAPKPFWLKK